MEWRWRVEYRTQQILAASWSVQPIRSTISDCVTIRCKNLKLNDHSGAWLETETGNGKLRQCSGEGNGRRVMASEHQQLLPHRLTLSLPGHSSGAAQLSSL